MSPNTTTQIFALQPMPRRARIWLNGITLYLLLQAALVFWLAGLQPIAMTIAGLSTLAIAGLMLWFRMASATVLVKDGALTLIAPLYGRAIPLAHILSGTARIVAPATDPTYRMTLRTNGLAVPGYRLGWFRAAGAGRTLVAQSADSALAFQTTDDYAVLLSVADRPGLARAIGQPIG